MLVGPGDDAAAVRAARRPLLFTTDKDMATAVIGLKHLIPRSDSQPAWNVAMSAALLTMLPPILVVVALQRSFVKGLVDSSK